MLKTHKIRLNPTPEQQQYFFRAAGIARFVWNWSLVEYKASKARKEKIDWNELKKKFNCSKRSEFSFVTEVTKCASEQAISDLRQSISTYYKTKPKDKKLKFPKVRKRSKKIGGFGLANDKFSISENFVKVPRLGLVNMTEPLRFQGKIMSGRVTEKAGHWYLSVVVEVKHEPVVHPKSSVGIDFGLSTFAVLSDGDKSETQAYFRKSQQKLKLLQRGLARKKKGSNNRAKWKLRIARMQEHTANQRKDFLHKFTNKVARKFSLICIEDLNLKGLCQTRLAKSFNDAGIGKCVRQLEYKTDFFGGLTQKVGRFFPSSKRCSNCYHINQDLALSDRSWVCDSCGTKHNRDLNAAMNIELEGKRLLAGDGFFGVTPVELATSGLNLGSG